MEFGVTAQASGVREVMVKATWTQSQDAKTSKPEASVLLISSWGKALLNVLITASSSRSPKLQKGLV